jgi:hypothetical protein
MKFGFNTGVIEIKLHDVTAYELQRKQYVCIYKKSSYLFWLQYLRFEIDGKNVYYCVLVIGLCFWEGLRFLLQKEGLRTSDTM